MSISTQYARGGIPPSLIKNYTVDFLDTILLLLYRTMVVFTFFTFIKINDDDKVGYTEKGLFGMFRVLEKTLAQVYFIGRRLI